ncbi:MAG: type II secretion system F family protein [Polyangiaceae bacterium]
MTLANAAFVLPRIDVALFKWGGVACLLGGTLAASFLLVADPAGAPRRYWARYVTFLERKLRRMFVWTSGLSIVLAQVVAVFFVVALHIAIDLPFWFLLVALILGLPVLWIERMRRSRVVEIESQIDGFVLAVANALKATPSLGDALRSVVSLTRDPLRQELELAMKEVRLGSSLDQSLLLLASRVGSRQLDSALSAILIGRQVGGNLPRVLETTANSLREMHRLEGVVRTKTAEGKMQLWVLALFPFVIIFALSSVSPGYFDALTESLVGYVLVAVATACWAASLVLARKILAVDV